MLCLKNKNRRTKKFNREKNSSLSIWNRRKGAIKEKKSIANNKVIKLILQNRESNQREKKKEKKK
jgi:hypothetical protein